MKTFSNFQELIDYCPNCIICGKRLEFHLHGRITDKKYQHGAAIHFHLKLKDETLVGKNKERIIVINVADNEIISGQDIVAQLMANWMTVYKKCNTCRFTITTKYTNGILKNPKSFPQLFLSNELVHFTRKHDKPVSIEHTYYDEATLLGIRTWILINNKPIVWNDKVFYIDFNKIQNLDQLNKRLSTILVFS